MRALEALARLLTNRLIESIPEAPATTDPFAGHPINCKCYFHR